MPTAAERPFPTAPIASRWRGDVALALGLVAGYLTWLVATEPALGVARDEGFYFQAAEAYGRWFEQLLREPALALTRAEIERHWAVNHEHPALMKSLFALSRSLLHERGGGLVVATTAHRLPAMLVSSLAVGLLFVWGRLAMGRRAGLVAALSFALMPRVFFHAHLACFDLPAAALALATSFALWQALEAAPGGRRARGWALGTGLVFGLYLNTKHNAWLFPALAVAMVAVVELDRWRGHRHRALGSSHALWVLPALLLGPVVLYLGWPWLWFEPFARLAEWVRFHRLHDYYNMEFLGVTYWKPPLPRLYAAVMTLATVPGITLALAGLGLGAGIRQELDARRRAHGARTRGATDEGPLIQGRTTPLLWLCAILVAYAPWGSSATPIFGGTKHWMTAYPCLCLFAGAGFELVARRLTTLLAGSGVRARLQRLVPLVLAAAVLTGPLLMTASSHPWGLAFYAPLVGGAPGAASLGLNRSFWGYSTGAVSGELAALAPPRARLYLHDTARQSAALMQRDGRLRPDLRPTLDIAGSDLGLYHHEPHMRRVEHQLWLTYGTVAPAVVGAYQGVPIVWLYTRPR